MADSGSNTLINAVIGAVITVVLSFTIVSPVIGGGVAGYLERSDGPRVGAISGAIALIPLLLFGILFIGLLSTGPMPFAVGLLFVIVAMVFAIIWTVGLSVLGGYLGVYLRSELS